MIINNKQMMELLEVKRDGLNSIKKRGKLKERLLKIGYNFIGETKEGRNVFYEIDPIYEINLHEEICIFTKDNFNTKNINFPRYYITTINNCDSNLPMSSSKRAKESGVKKHNVDNWDKKLVKKGIIENNGYSYALVNNRNNIYIYITENQYNEIKSNMYQLRNKAFDYKRFSKKEPDIWKAKKKTYALTEINAIKSINKCFEGTEHIKGMININWSTPKEKSDALDKLYHYNITKIKKHHLNKDNDLHKASIALYSKVVK